MHDKVGHITCSAANSPSPSPSPLTSPLPSACLPPSPPSPSPELPTLYAIHAIACRTGKKEGGREGMKVGGEREER